MHACNMAMWQGKKCYKGVHWTLTMFETPDVSTLLTVGVQMLFHGVMVEILGLSYLVEMSFWFSLYVLPLGTVLQLKFSLVTTVAVS